jgi:acetyl-CoA acetyltransferase
MASGSRDVAIVGIGQSDFGALYNTRDTFRDAHNMGAQALRLALEDAGIEKSGLDGLLAARIGYQRLADITGLRHLTLVNNLPSAGRFSGVGIQYAAGMIKAGLVDTVALVYGNNGRSVKQKYGGEGDGPTVGYDAMYGMTSPGAYVGMMYRRYRQMYGAPEDALAPLAINNRRNAARNPIAVMRSEITTEEYMAERYIADPLRRLDYCIINDGAVALILTTMERAKDMRKRPVKVHATAAMSDLWNFYTSRDFFFEGCQRVAQRLYNETGMKPSDMDCLQVYDNFTPTILFSIEGFNHAPRGQAWDWVRNGRIELEGEMPINTAGGHTGESYMQGWALHAEAVRQIRGEAEPERQLKKCDAVQYMCASPIIGSHILTGA